jgi:hypothetical protein
VSLSLCTAKKLETGNKKALFCENLLLQVQHMVLSRTPISNKQQQQQLHLLYNY